MRRHQMVVIACFNVTDEQVLKAYYASPEVAVRLDMDDLKGPLQTVCYACEQPFTGPEFLEEECPGDPEEA